MLKLNVYVCCRLCLLNVPGVFSTHTLCIRLLRRPSGVATKLRTSVPGRHLHRQLFYFSSDMLFEFFTGPRAPADLEHVFHTCSISPATFCSPSCSRTRYRAHVFAPPPRTLLTITRRPAWPPGVSLTSHSEAIMELCWD